MATSSGASGINNDSEKYSVTIRVDREDGPALEGFCQPYNGVKALLWTRLRIPAD